MVLHRGGSGAETKPSRLPWRSAAIDRSTPRPLAEGTPLALITGDDIALSTLEYGPATAEVAVVFGHGFTGSQRNRKVVELVSDLVARGFAVYTADFRGHGDSAGRSTYGEEEVRDLEAVVAVARRRHPKVVTVGASMGALVALRHVGLGGRVDAVVAISSPVFGSIPNLPRARFLGRLVRSERGRQILERYGTRTAPFAPVSSPPIELAPMISTPVGIVHGGRDRYVPLAEAQALDERLTVPHRFVVLPDFGHAEAGFGPTFADVLEPLIRDLLDPAAPATADEP